MNDWEGKRVLVTGGSSFIGSHLVQELLKQEANVTVVDNLSTGSLNNFKWGFSESVVGDPHPHCTGAFEYKNFTFVEGDLRNPNVADNVIRGKEVVFHLAAVHGGREFISAYPADCCQSLAINENVFRSCAFNRVHKVIFSSSVCVYPNEIQLLGTRAIKEDDVTKNGWVKPDSTYGWAKLTGEKALRAYLKQYKLKSSILRYTTTFGPRENATHAIIALIKRALAKESPFIVWGSGQQCRDFIYVDDVVRGTILGAERIEDATPINLVGSRMYSMVEIIDMIFALVGWRPKEITFDTTKPEGPKKRFISGERAKKLLNFTPEVSFENGLSKTIKWCKEEYAKGRLV